MDEGQVLPTGGTAVAVGGTGPMTNGNGAVFARVFTHSPDFGWQAALDRIKDGAVEEPAGPMPGNRIGNADLNENDEVARLDGNGTRPFLRKIDGTTTTTRRDFRHPNPGDWSNLDLNDAGQVSFTFHTATVGAAIEPGLSFDTGPVLRPAALFGF
ncbi:hypothetical protein DKT77_09605 [Meridianimarinicoccus roseus]|uniref:Uncharacterized protein n=2 Tax=Meridianimarinicoccus roseus TaxID=2072018 RepID=A0A2V2LM61_9RHOB|nr:hypothetical protein DKT77_09605 [Meridianimarinicoccus roseus]